MEEILDFLGASGTWTVILILLFGFFTTLFEGLAGDELKPSREKLRERLENDGWTKTTRRILTRWLDRTDQVLSPDELARGAAKNSLSLAFSRRLVDLTMAIAFVYPIGALFVQLWFNDVLIIGAIHEFEDSAKYGIIFLIISGTLTLPLRRVIILLGDPCFLDLQLLFGLYGLILF